MKTQGRLLLAHNTCTQTPQACFKAELVYSVLAMRPRAVVPASVTAVPSL